MSVERKPKGFTFDKVVSTAKELTLKYGSHSPIITVEGTARSIPILIDGFPETPEEKKRVMFIAGGAFAQSCQIGHLEQVIFVSEGWMSIAEEENVIVIPPSQNTNRVEVLLITSLNISREAPGKTVLFEMIRDEDGNLIDLEEFELIKEHEDSRSENPLLHAFVDGFREGVAQQN